MITETKCNIFAVELSYIQDAKIRSSAQKIISLLPDYYFHEPASSTGKYHPKFSLGERGLVRHVKVAVRYAQELFNIYKFDQETKDLIIFALIIHDGIKKGRDGSKMMAFDHPLLIGDFLREHESELELSSEQLERIIKMDASHMGRWNTNKFEPDVVLPIPKTVEEKFVHMCDYLSSRKWNNVSFDADDNILE